MKVGTQDDARTSSISFARSAPASAVAAAAPLATEAVADSETNDEKRKSRYRETDDVKTFYRVNRYPS